MSPLEKKVRKYISDMLVDEIEQEGFFKGLWEEANTADESEVDELPEIYRVIRKVAKEVKVAK